MGLRRLGTSAKKVPSEVLENLGNWSAQQVLDPLVCYYLVSISYIPLITCNRIFMILAISHFIVVPTSIEGSCRGR